MKILSAEYNLDSPTIVAYASVVRIYNGDSSNILVTRKASGGTVIGSFMVPAGKVVYVEKDYTDTLDANANVKASKTAFSPMMSFALMSAADPVPTYTHSVSATDVDEGGSFTTTITTTNVDDGTNLYWELSGSGITSGDFSSGALTGTATISSNSATFSHTVAEDSTTEGTETITIKVYSDSGRTEQVGNTLSVNIADTSTAPPAGEWSSQFTGNNYLLADVSTGALNSGDYTYECWIYPTGITNNSTDQWHAFLSRWKSGNYCFVLELNRDSGNLLFAWGDGNNYQGQQQHTGTFNNNQWYHVALVRNGTNAKVYVNGESKLSVTVPDASSNNTLPLCIGSHGDGYTAYNFVGRIHDVRLVNGAALYTSNFTPPTTPLTNVSSCKFLGCKDKDPTYTVVNRLEGAPYGQSIDNYGNVSTTSVDPYTWNHYFSGDDYLGMGSNSDWNLSGSDFTLEAWIYRTSNPSWAGILGQWEYNNYNANNSWVMESVGTTMSFYYCSTTGNVYHADGPSAMSLNTWHHVATTRSGNTINVWVDGVKGADHTIVGSIQNVSRQAFIGGNVAGSGYFVGYMTDLKLTKGQVLYTANFTPTRELTLTSDGSTDGNVKLMCMDQSTPTAATRSPESISNLGGTIDSYRATTGP
jgi:hypothetical protein